MQIILLIAAGGICGTLLRYLCICIAETHSAFPWGTLTVNTLGSFIAGFCYVWLKNKYPAYEVYFPVLFIGFLGAFTTFSSFALECARFADNAQYGKLLLNIVLQNFCGISAAAAGVITAKMLVKEFICR